MIRDTIPFSALWGKFTTSPFPQKSVASFIRFIERRLGVAVSYDASLLPFQAPDLADLTLLAERMRAKDVITAYYPVPSLPDEPPVHQWHAQFTGGKESTSGGSSVEGRWHALVAALAEAAERHVWMSRDDYFVSPTIATPGDIAKKGLYLAPEAFAGFSPEQRAHDADLTLHAESRYLWVRGYSWTAKKPIWAPAQVISGSSRVHQACRERHEPRILHSITNGLSTWPGRQQAVCGGALELIERDAYSIMWFNQLSLPRFDIAALAARRPSLAKLLQSCERYRLEPHAVRLITDAPTYAVMAVITDKTAHVPRTAIGLKAGQDPAAAFEKALLEALRARRTGRINMASAPEEIHSKETAGIGHFDRLLYWMIESRADHLKFLTTGPVQNFSEPWEMDSNEEHFSRIIEWCRAQGYDLASVSLTRSAGNVTPWHIEMVVMPQLQPVHLTEKQPYIGGARLMKIPKLFGYEPLAHPYTDAPHPFA